MTRQDDKKEIIYHHWRQQANHGAAQHDIKWWFDVKAVYLMKRKDCEVSNKLESIYTVLPRASSTMWATHPASHKVYKATK